MLSGSGPQNGGPTAPPGGTDHPHRVHTHDHLVTTVWGYGHVGDRTVDGPVARLRRKLGADPAHDPDRAPGRLQVRAPTGRTGHRGSKPRPLDLRPPASGRGRGP
ncbi:hypothetical protein GCM10020367_18370 [Streptomyces sannanensis]|uniref:OmpR/PhoB-type domain-containing protein n=1 Tax=Streptomyces sannanensis TaxID=285536 RepID=A0ABP6S8J3_9ACTN